MFNRMCAATILAAVLATLAIAQEIPDKPAIPQRDTLDVWPGYLVIPWSFNTPPLNDATAKAYREQGINGIHVDKLISPAEGEWIDKHKFRFYVDHAAGKGTLYLRERKQLVGRHPATQFDAGDGFVRRPKCLRDPKVLAEVEALVRANVTAAAKHGVACYALDDEISIGNFLSAVEACWCPSCQPAFRRFALALYGGSLEKLNAEWGTHFKSADEISPVTAADPIRQATTLTVDKWNFARWADFHQFGDQTLSDVLVRLAKVANEIDPKVPVGFEGGQQPCAFGGYDWSRLSRAVQWVEAYDYGNNNEIVRSLAPQVVRMKTFFSTQDKIKDSHRLWYHFVHGDRGVILWPAWGKEGSWWNEKAEIRKELAYLPAIFRELTGERMAKLLAGAEFVDDGIAVYYSQPSMRATWIMDATVHGDSWPGRSGGVESASSTTLLGRYAWVAMLENLALRNSSPVCKKSQILSG
ncbi:MAG: beta-galactosidase [Phycisphaerae bacterium]|nr:beta-galactosidase [Phycisphaerae bacterium]